MLPTEEAKKTFQLEKRRSLLEGALFTAETTFFMLIAIRVFEMSAFEKSLIAASGSVGMMLGPFIVYLVAQFSIPPSKAIAAIFGVGALGFLLNTLFWNAQMFMASAMLYVISARAVLPLFIQIYSDNYPKEYRGKIFSKTARLRILSNAICSVIIGKILEVWLGFSVWLMAFYCFSMLMSAGYSSCYPSQKLSPNEGSFSVFRSFRHLAKDLKFTWILSAWMFLGLGNLIMLPLRVEYLAQKQYGWNLSESEIAFLTALAPALMQFFLVGLWGRIFDVMNFFLTRIFINICLMLWIAFFFLSSHVVGVFVGCLCLGMAMAGASVAWSLWVTKFAPPDAVADYMSIHTFTTGMRLMIAPFIGFYLIESIPVSQTVMISLGLIILATLMHLPEVTTLRKRRSGEPLTEDNIE